MELELGGLSHLFVSFFLYNLSSILVLPAITDVTMAAICPGEDECSLAIYLSGLQQAIVGVGMVVMMPLIGKLSDVYGRKTLLTIPFTLSIIPLGILAYSQTTNFFYAYYAIKFLTSMVNEAAVQCLAVAYVADNISDEKRISAFGVLSGIGTAAFIFGTLAARLLSGAQAFQVAAAVAVAALIYMRVFLKDTRCHHDASVLPNDALVHPILQSGSDIIQSDDESSKKIQIFKKIPSPGDLICLLKSRVTISQAAFVALFNGLGVGGTDAILMYFLKARFQFNKNQFADIILVTSIAATISQLLLMPKLAPIVGDEKLLSTGLFVGSLAMLLESIAWSSWIPYVVSVFALLSGFINPSLQSILSKQVGSHEQGIAQGCISSVNSLANIISPFIYNPLAAIFLSETAPFYFPGFSVMCIALALMIAFTISTMMKAPHISSQEIDTTDSTDA